MRLHKTVTYKTVTDLITAGLVSVDEANITKTIAQRHPIRIPSTVAKYLKKRNSPLARQFLPHPNELQNHPDDLKDPIGDNAHSPVKGIIHRYPDRVLLLPTMVCAVHCRFCFRRERVGKGILNTTELTTALNYIRHHPEIKEVILSGGDPLILSPQRYRSIRHSLAQIPHIQLLRIHSRIPLVAPEKITDEMILALSEPMENAPTLWLSVHVNHKDELIPEADETLKRLANAGIPLLAQTVLLRGVNDDPKILESLFRALLQRRIRPYYLHHPDRACGTAHFRLTIPEGQEIYKKLQEKMGRLCLPTYVLDQPNGDGKINITPRGI